MERVNDNLEDFGKCIRLQAFCIYIYDLTFCQHGQVPVAKDIRWPLEVSGGVEVPLLILNNFFT